MEPISNNAQRLVVLVKYLRLLYQGPVTKEIFEGYQQVLTTATANEVNDALDEVLQKAEDIDSWKMPVARFIRSVSRGLDEEALTEYPPDSIFARLEEENNKIEAELSAIQTLLLKPQGGSAGDPNSIEEVKKRLSGFSLLKTHYQRLQNELFPLFEQSSLKHKCVSLMWALQDDVLVLQASLTNTKALQTRFWNDLGAFYVTAGTLLYRERRILYPVAFRLIPERLRSSANVSERAREEKGVKDAMTAEASVAANTVAAVETYVFSTITGSLKTQELEAIFKTLPVDISFIGPDDRVKFYSDPPHRIFPRAPAVVGRLVQNCHPPKSVAIVEEILSSFKNGEKDNAEFWLESKGAFIHIQYFALRDIDGLYLGTMEVSQDASRLRSLEGEKRLL
jgi:DUF438 domain-containing protein